MQYVSLSVVKMIVGSFAVALASPSVFAADDAGSTFVSVRHAQGFTIERAGDLKIVRIEAPLRSWANANADVEVQRDVVILRPRGSDAEPPAALADAPIIETPVRTVAVNYGTDEAFMIELGAKDRLVAVGGTYSYQDDIREKVATGEIKQLGYSWHAPPYLDVAARLDPDVFFMSLVSLDHAPALEQARELGVSTVPVFASSERDYLGRAEWMKFYGAFLGLDAEAEALFSQIEARVEALRARVVEEGERREVLLAYYAGRDRWIATVRGPDAQLLRDAGGDNPFAEEEDVQRSEAEPISSERLLIEGADAPCWIIGDVHGALLPRERFMESFRAWREDCLWGNTRRSKPQANAFDLYEQGRVRPDLVLEDLVAILNPHLLSKELDFFEPFEKEADQ